MVRKVVGIRFLAAHWCSLLTCWQYNRRLKLVDAPRPGFRVGAVAGFRPW